MCVVQRWPRQKIGTKVQNKYLFCRLCITEYSGVQVATMSLIQTADWISISYAHKHLWVDCSSHPKLQIKLHFPWHMKWAWEKNVLAALKTIFLEPCAHVLGALETIQHRNCLEGTLQIALISLKTCLPPATHANVSSPRRPGPALCSGIHGKRTNQASDELLLR